MASAIAGEQIYNPADTSSPVIFDSVFRPFAAKTGLLYPAKRCDFVEVAGIDTDHAVFQLLGDAPDTGGIVTVK